MSKHSTKPTIKTSRLSIQHSTTAEGHQQRHYFLNGRLVAKHLLCASIAIAREVRLLTQDEMIALFSTEGQAQ